jgi:anti-sigma factor RsiW
MSCSFAEKISLLIDGELPFDEEGRVRQHLASCHACQEAQKNFLHLREQIKSYESEPDLAAERRVLQAALASAKPRWWQRRVSLPAPVFALLVIALLAVAAWTALTRAGNRRPEPERLTRSAPQVGQGASDLSVYDRGGRAAIYKTRR